MRIRKLVTAAALMAAFGCGVAAPAGAHDRDAAYFVAASKKQHLKVSFYVADGKVRRPIIEARRVPCTKPDARGTVTAYMPAAEIAGDRFRSRYQARYDRYTLEGSIGGGTAKVHKVDKAIDCESGTLTWKAHEVTHKQWNDFRPPGRPAAGWPS